MTNSYTPIRFPHSDLHGTTCGCLPASLVVSGDGPKECTFVAAESVWRNVECATSIVTCTSELVRSEWIVDLGVIL